MATGNIFISYRREDSAAYAGRISDHLSALFGADRVFMDVEDIAPGQNFAQTIDQTIASCSVVLVIIGPRWMEILRERSQESQQDFVCHEIQAALAHHITVIPVLVGGATMAQLSGVTGPMADLPLHQAAELRDGAFKEDCTRLANALRAHPGLKTARAQNPARRKLLLGAGAAAALIGLLVALSSAIGIGPWSEYRVRQTRIHQLLATAQTQMNQAEYESAFKTYHAVLAIDATHRAAMDLQVDAAMLWLRNFHVLIPEGQKAQDLAGPPLAEIMSVLEAGLARTNGRGSRAADILAHLGWAHWLNQHLAYKEFGPAAERGLRSALSIDPANVYANAMLGNWLLQTHGSLDEALHHFEAAVNSGKERSLVRQMQLGGMIYNEDPGVRRALIQVANQMRINSEPITERYKSRVLSTYSPVVNSENELRETLSAVAPNDSWATFLWLDDQPARGGDSDQQRIRREFIHAGILELDGKPSEALAIFKKLEREMKARGYSGRLADHIAGAIKRLSR